MTITDQSTVGEAKAYLRERLLEGAECSCCTQRAQMYRRTITAGMALGMIAVHRAVRDGHGDADGFVHAEDTFRDAKATGMRLPAAVRGDFAKLRFWGLAEQADETRPDGSPRNGHWRLTEKGELFVAGRLAVPRYVWLYNNRAYTPPAGAAGVGETTTLRAALGEAFDFAELMGGGQSAPSSRHAA